LVVVAVVVWYTVRREDDEAAEYKENGEDRLGSTARAAILGRLLLTIGRKQTLLYLIDSYLSGLKVGTGSLENY
jgi:hypothetical protein